MVWCHIHSTYSVKDALPQVHEIVSRAVQLEYPALALTDHGNMGGARQLVHYCRKAGIEPLPGLEAYVAFDRGRPDRKSRPETFHMGMLATSEVGYRNLVGLHNLSHRNHFYKPTLDLGDLAQAAEDGMLDGVYGLSGCFFGIAQKMLREGSPEDVLTMLKGLAGWFGAGFAIELQHHQIFDKEHDDDLQVRFMHDVSERLGLPTVIAQDSHYVLEADRADHDQLKWLAAWGEPGDAQFPGALGYHMVGFDDVRHLYPVEIWDKAMRGLDDLANMAKVRIPEMETFQLQVPDVTVTGDPYTEMETLCWERLAILESIVPKAKLKRYALRLDDELEVINNSGFAGYLLLVRQVCQELERRGIVWSIRGSASGSLVCWLLGITELDPLQWNLRFDRFLSTDRTKPPDIDIDMDPNYRESMVDWLAQRFYVLRVGLWSKYGLYSEFDPMFDPDKPQRGSLPSAYWYAVTRILEKKHGKDKHKWPPEARAKLDEKIPQVAWKALENLDRYHSYKNYGTHAAGIVVAPSEAAIESIPQLYVASKPYLVSAFDKDDIEAVGLVKLDLLNLKLHTAIKVIQDITHKDPKAIPLNDTNVFRHINKVGAVGLFQLEGGATANGVRRMRPKNIKDIIAAMALFRPATMDSGATDDYLNRRSKNQLIPDRHPLIAKTTRDTYGILLYQEQAIQIFRDLGMSIEEIEQARKAIKASNAGVHDAAKVLQALLLTVDTLSEEQGMTQEDRKYLGDALQAFAGYSFNLAHATMYGIWAYRTAWYRLYYPVAFWAGMLVAHSGDAGDRVRKYQLEAKADGVPILPPHINRSGITYTVDAAGGAIYRGLTTINGVGDKAAANIVENAPYTSLDDFASRVGSRAVSGSKNLGLGVHPAECSGIVTLLHKAGALRDLGWETK
jgi:DNA polymerase III subunit alpha